MERLSGQAARHALGWLLDGHHDILSDAGWDATGWDSAVWIPHAIYETALLPGGLTHDEDRRIDMDAGLSETGNPAIDDILSRAVATGGELGRTGYPGEEWSRLRWRKLAARIGLDPWPPDTPPYSDWFPYRSWPVNILPPGEGSLDREQFIRLLGHLADASPDGFDTRCHAYYALCATKSGEEVVYRCELSDLPELYEDEDVYGSPSNFWPDGAAWYVYTDWDYWGSKVSGTYDLTARLTADADLETIDTGR